MADSTVVYVLNIQGNAEEVLERLIPKVKNLGDSAKKTEDKIGGLSGALGAAGLGIAGAVSLELVKKAYETMFRATVAAKQWMDETVKLSKELQRQGVIVQGATSALASYNEASLRLGFAFQRMQVALATQLSPEMTKFVDALTGAAVLLGSLPAKIGVVVDSLRLLAQATASSGGIFGSLTGGGALVAIDAATALIAKLEQVGSGVERPDLTGTGGFLSSPGADPALVAEAKRRRGQFIAVAGTAGGLTAGGTSFDLRVGPALDKLSATIAASLTPMAEMNDALMALEGSVREQTDELRLASAAETAAGIEGALSGGLNGVLTAAGGPIGALVASIFSIVQNLPEFLTGLVQEVLNIQNMDFAGLIDAIAEGVIKAIPELITSFVTLAPRLVLELVAAAPALFASLIDAIEVLPGELMRQIRDILTGLPEAFSKGIGRLGDSLAIHLGSAAAGRREFLGVHIPKFDRGGEVTRTGLAVVHAGERVLPAGSRGGGLTVNGGLHLHGVQDVRGLMEQLRRLQGSYGANMRLDPYTAG